jgi:hypothetical protein
MDIKSRINYEKLFKLDILDPETEAPVGITMMIRSDESDEAKQVFRRHADDNHERVQRGKLIKGRTRERQILEQTAACIASWDWGDNTWGGEVPTLTMKSAIEVLDGQGWIFAQVREASAKVSNFTQTSGEGSAGS